DLKIFWNKHMKNEHLNFTFFSANIHRFAPHIGWDKHEELYKQFKAFHTVADKWETKVNIKTSGDLKKAGILTVFHLGNHEILPVALARYGLDFDILLSRDVYKRFAAVLQRHQAYFQRQGKSVNFLFAEENGVIFKLKKSILENRHILIFADGNLGSGDHRAKMLPVSFMNGKLWVKSGIAFLSYLLQIPVYVLLDDMRKEELVIDIQSPIEIRAEEKGGIFIQRCMQEIYDRLATRLEQRLFHWACWASLHTNGMFKEESHLAEVEAGAQLVCLEVGNETYLFD